MTSGNSGISLRVSSIRASILKLGKEVIKEVQKRLDAADMYIYTISQILWVKRFSEITFSVVLSQHVLVIRIKRLMFYIMNFRKNLIFILRKYESFFVSGQIEASIMKMTEFILISYSKIWLSDPMLETGFYIK